MALRSRVTPTQAPANQVRFRYNLLLLRDGSKTVPHPYHCLRHYTTDAPLQLTPNTQVTYTGPTLRPCHLPHASDPPASAGIDPLTGTLIQRCGETGTGDTDIRVLCPSRDRPPHGHATTGAGSSGFSAGLVSLPAIHELPLDDSSGDADSKVDAHPPYPIQIGVPPISSNTGPWDSGLAADSRWPHTTSCRDWTCRDNFAPFSGRRECLPKQGRRPLPLIMGQLLRAPSTNA